MKTSRISVGACPTSATRLEPRRFLLLALTLSAPLVAAYTDDTIRARFNHTSKEWKAEEDSPVPGQLPPSGDAAPEDNNKATPIGSASNPYLKTFDFIPSYWLEVPDASHQYDPGAPNLGHGSSGAAEIIEIDGVAALARAARLANHHGRVVLLTTTGLLWALTVLNHMHFLSQFGFDGVLPILGGEEECRRATEQSAVAVRVCAWVAPHCMDPLNPCPPMDPHSSHNPAWPGNRMVWLEQLALMGYQVLMADTDVCFVKDPFPALVASNHTIVTSGFLLNFNLGGLFADGRSPRGTQDLGMLRVANERYRELLVELHRFNKEHGPGSVSMQAVWDQDVMNDAFHQWVAARPIYSRACINAGYKTGELKAGCFSRCCEEEQRRAWQNYPYGHQAVAQEAMQAFEKERDEGRPHPLVLAASIGHCPTQVDPDCGPMQIADEPEHCSMYGVVHLNTCPDPPFSWGWARDTNFNISDPGRSGKERHVQFLRDNCWLPALTDLAKEWGVYEKF